MKSLFTLLCIVALPFCGNSQVQVLKLYATDALGNRDSVQVGFDFDATLGVDPALNEVNIFGQPASPLLDMRVIQRDQANHFCLAWHPFSSSPPAPPLYFPENLDLKTDIRRLESHNSPYWHNYQIWVRALNYPVKISVDTNSPLYANYSLDWSLITTLDSACTYSPFNGFYFTNADSLAVLASSAIHSVVIYFDHEVSRPDLLEVNPWKIIQNPVSDYLLLQMEQPEEGRLEILDGVGRVVSLFSLNGTETERLSTGFLPPGLYYLRLHTKLNPNARLKKMIKQ